VAAVAAFVAAGRDEFGGCALFALLIMEVFSEAETYSTYIRDSEEKTPSQGTSSD